MKKVIVTGSTGLIGKETIKPLKEAGFTVVLLLASECNLFDYNAVSSFVKKAHASHILHFAWFTGRGYVTSAINKDYYKASMHLLRSFIENGGTHAVFAGSCLEYAPKEGALEENDALSYISEYAKYKNLLHSEAELYAQQSNIYFSWGRIFYAYGASDTSGSLLSYTIKHLQENKKVEIHSGHLLRDYIYTKDIANAFVKLILLNKSLCTNICTGTAVNIANYVEMIAILLNKLYLIRVHEIESDEPKNILGSTKILRDTLGFSAQYSLKNALKEVLHESKNRNENTCKK